MPGNQLVRKIDQLSTDFHVHPEHQPIALAPKRSRDFGPVRCDVLYPTV